MGLAAGTVQHHADSGKDLSEFVVKVPCNAAQRLLLNIDQFPGEFAQLAGLHLELFGQVVQLRKGLSAGFQRVEPRPKRQKKQECGNPKDIGLDVFISCVDPVGGIRLRLIIQHQKPGNDF